MLIEVRPKSTAVAYVLWFVLGAFAAHQFYTRRFASAALMIGLYWFGWIVTIVGGIQAGVPSEVATTATVKVGVAMLGASGLWWLADAFLIPGWVSHFGDTAPRSKNFGGAGEEVQDFSAADDAIARYKARQSVEAAKETAKPTSTFLKPMNARPVAPPTGASFGRR